MNCTLGLILLTSSLLFTLSAHPRRSDEVIARGLNQRQRGWIDIPVRQTTGLTLEAPFKLNVNVLQKCVVAY